MENAVERLMREDYFEEELLGGLDLRGADLCDKNFVGCTFRRSTLQESSWSKTRLEDCVFEGCDLSRARVAGMALRGGAFTDCRLMGVDWSDVARNPTLAFERCNLRYSSFVSVNLTRTRFVDCRITDVQFIDSRLVEADFSKSDLAGSRFEHCDLRETDFGEARNVHCDPAINRVKGARISIASAALLAVSFGMRVNGFGDDA